MKRILASALLACALLLCAGASAQTLPGLDCFSPGLLRVGEALSREGQTLSVDASFTVQNAFYARDLSVLSDMLSGLTLRYDGSADFDRLRLIKGEDTLLDAALTGGEEGAILALNGKGYAIDSEAALLAAGLGFAPQEGGIAQALLSVLTGEGLFESVPLQTVAATLESLCVGDELPGGIVVERAFALGRTMSDDGARLTRIDIDGALGLPGEAPYEISGWMRHGGGKAPKDTFELTLTRDKDNGFTLTGSSTRTSEIARRDKAGTARVQSTYSSDGRLAGNRVSSRLTVRLTNAWTADEEAGLSEQITATVHLGHTDRTPGRQMLRLNDIAADLKATLRLTTHEGADAPLVMKDEATLLIAMDHNDFFSGGVNASVRVGGEAQRPEIPAEVEALDAPGPLGERFEETARELAKALYARLGSRSLDKVKGGLK